MIELSRARFVVTIILVAVAAAIVPAALIAAPPSPLLSGIDNPWQPASAAF